MTSHTLYHQPEEEFSSVAGKSLITVHILRESQRLKFALYVIELLICPTFIL